MLFINEIGNDKKNSILSGEYVKLFVFFFLNYVWWTDKKKYVFRQCKLLQQTDEFSLKITKITTPHMHLQTHSDKLSVIDFLLNACSERCWRVHSGNNGNFIPYRGSVRAQKFTVYSSTKTCMLLEHPGSVACRPRRFVYKSMTHLMDVAYANSQTRRRIIAKNRQLIF